jgi:hypothetical protein
MIVNGWQKCPLRRTFLSVTNFGHFYRGLTCELFIPSLAEVRLVHLPSQQAAFQTSRPSGRWADDPWQADPLAAKEVRTVRGIPAGQLLKETRR